MRPSRPPQRALRLETAAPDAARSWCAGGRIAYLGGALVLRLDTNRRITERVNDELHLALPPEATPRQICDAAESWLREEARRVFEKSAAARRGRMSVVLAFGKRSDWARQEEGRLRCHWRLIEHPPAVIEQVIARALAETPAPVCDDLFASA